MAALVAGAAWWFGIFAADLFGLVLQPRDDATASRMFLTGAVAFGAPAMVSAVLVVVRAVRLDWRRSMLIMVVAAATFGSLAYRYIGLTQEQDAVYRGYSQHHVAWITLGWGLVAGWLSRAVFGRRRHQTADQ